MVRNFLFGLLALCCLVRPLQVQAQPVFDPRPTLNILINAFQFCGPPQAYQTMSSRLVQVVAAQTGGTGCYPSVAALGTVTGMQVVGVQQFPIGPLYSIRAQHLSGPVNWVIGFNGATGQVEHIDFQVAYSPSPNSGPVYPNRGQLMPVPDEPVYDDPNPPENNEEEKDELARQCERFPSMCPTQ